MEIEIGSERVSNRLTVVSWWAKRTFLRELLEPEAPEKMGRCEGEDLSEGLRKLAWRQRGGRSERRRSSGWRWRWRWHC